MLVEDIIDLKMFNDSLYSCIWLKSSYFGETLLRPQQRMLVELWMTNPHLGLAVGGVLVLGVFRSASYVFESSTSPVPVESGVGHFLYENSHSLISSTIRMVNIQTISNHRTNHSHPNTVALDGWLAWLYYTYLPNLFHNHGEYPNYQQPLPPRYGCFRGLIS